MYVRYWIVDARDGVHNAASLHDLAAQHVLTLRPTVGDTIWAEGEAACRLEEDGTLWMATRTCRATRGRADVVLLSHPGRSALLGEDGLEDAYGHDVLAELLAEHLWCVDADALDAAGNLRQDGHPPRWQLAQRMHDVPWRFAPVEVLHLPDCGDEEEDDRRYAKCEAGPRLVATWPRRGGHAPAPPGGDTGMQPYTVCQEDPQQSRWQWVVLDARGDPLSWHQHLRSALAYAVTYSTVMNPRLKPGACV